jgi:predicted ester cyclase
VGVSRAHPPAPMLENENTAVVRRWFEEVWNQRRLATIDELLAPDAVAHDLGGPGASVRGPEAFRRAAEILHGAFGELHLVVQDIFGVGDRVAVRLTARMKNTGKLGDLEPTGNVVTVAVMCMIHLRDGKIIEGWNFWDVTAALRAANAPTEKTTLL